MDTGPSSHRSVVPGSGRAHDPRWASPSRTQDFSWNCGDNGRQESVQALSDASSLLWDSGAGLGVPERTSRDI